MGCIKSKVAEEPGDSTRSEDCWEKMGLKTRPSDNEAGSPNQGHKKPKHKRGSSSASNQLLVTNVSEIATSSRPSRTEEKYAKIKRGPNTKSSRLASQVPKSTGRTAARQRERSSQEKLDKSIEESRDRQGVHGASRTKNTDNKRLGSGDVAKSSGQHATKQSESTGKEKQGHFQHRSTEDSGGMQIVHGEQQTKNIDNKKFGSRDVAKSTGQNAAKQSESTGKEKQGLFQHRSTEDSGVMQTVHGEQRTKNIDNKIFGLKNVAKSTGQNAARQREITSKEKQDYLPHRSIDDSGGRQTVNGKPRRKNTDNERFGPSDEMFESETSMSQQMQNEATESKIQGDLATNRTKGVDAPGKKVDPEILLAHLINKGKHSHATGEEAILHKTRTTVSTYQTESTIVLPVNLIRAEPVATQPKQEEHNEGNPTDRQSQKRYKYTNKSQLHHQSEHTVVKQENLIKNPAELQLKENNYHLNLPTTAKNQRIRDPHSQNSEDYKDFAKFDPEHNSWHTKPQLQNNSSKVEVDSNTEFKDFGSDDHALKVSKGDAQILPQSLKSLLDSRSASKCDTVTYNKSAESTITLPEVKKTERNISEVYSNKGNAISPTGTKFVESDKTIQSFDASVSENSVVQRITVTEDTDWNMVESSENSWHTMTQETPKSQSHIEQNVVTYPIHTVVNINHQVQENQVPMVKQGIKRNSIDDSMQPWKKTYHESPKTLQEETLKNKVDFGDLECEQSYQGIWSTHQVSVTDPIQSCENLEDKHFAEVQHKQENENGAIDESMQMVVKVDDKYLATFNKIEQLFQESRKFEKLASEFVGKVGTQEHYYIDESLARLLLQLDDLGVLKNETLKLERRKVIKYIYHLLDVLEERATS